MALKLNEEHQLTGTGLGYQHSCYAMMRALCNRSGLKYGVGKHDLVALRACLLYTSPSPRDRG